MLGVRRKTRLVGAGTSLVRHVPYAVVACWLQVGGEGGVKSDPVYQRIRAACCSEHGLGARAGIPRNAPEALDEHAAQIVAVVVKAKRDNPRRAA